MQPAGDVVAVLPFAVLGLALSLVPRQRVLAVRIVLIVLVRLFLLLIAAADAVDVNRCQRFALIFVR